MARQETADALTRTRSGRVGRAAYACTRPLRPPRAWRCSRATVARLAIYFYPIRKKREINGDGSLTCGEGCLTALANPEHAVLSPRSEVRLLLALATAESIAASHTAHPRDALAQAATAYAVAAGELAAIWLEKVIGCARARALLASMQDDEPGLHAGTLDRIAIEQQKASRDPKGAS